MNIEVNIVLFFNYKSAFHHDITTKKLLTANFYCSKLYMNNNFTEIDRKNKK